jgi:two-component sensor histidine kinase
MYKRKEKNIFFCLLFLDLCLATISIINRQSYQYYFWTVFLLGGVITTLFVCYWIKSRDESKKNTRIISELKSGNKTLVNAVDFKNTLLKENHHRVKNNFQMIISLLNIEARFDKDKAISDHIEKAETRIGILALLYDSFSEYEKSNKVCLQVYVEKLVAFNRQMMKPDQVAITVAIDQIRMDIQIAVSFGLIINELVCNSLKHAFPKDAKGKIVISIKQKTEGIYAFHYSDDGTKGKAEAKNKNSLGLKLIGGLVEQIKGFFINIDWSHGLTYEFKFKNML